MNDLRGYPKQLFLMILKKRPGKSSLATVRWLEMEMEMEEDGEEVIRRINDKWNGDLDKVKISEVN